MPVLRVAELFELKAAMQLYAHADLEGVKLDTVSLTPRMQGPGRMKKWTNTYKYKPG